MKYFWVSIVASVRKSEHEYLNVPYSLAVKTDAPMPTERMLRKFLKEGSDERIAAVQLLSFQELTQEQYKYSIANN